MFVLGSWVISIYKYTPNGHDLSREALNDYKQKGFDKGGNFPQKLFDV